MNQPTKADRSLVLTTTIGGGQAQFGYRSPLMRRGRAMQLLCLFEAWEMCGVGMMPMPHKELWRRIMRLQRFLSSHP